MEFGRVADPSGIDFTIPNDHPDTVKILEASPKDSRPDVYIGCAKWNRQDLKGFYPRGTKDELPYYATQFNCIELNATFYNIPSPEQITKWRDKTPEGFLFFPKISRSISHSGRLNEEFDKLRYFCDSIRAFEDRLGVVFLQMHDYFRAKDIEKMTDFLEQIPEDIPLAVEVRNKEWFGQSEAAESLYQAIQSSGATNILVDTAGRRDMMHMRLSNNSAFIRWVGANHNSDFTRLDDWVDRIEQWLKNGLQNLFFFVHQNTEVESPLLAAELIKKLNNRCGLKLKVPGADEQQELF